MRGLFTDGAAVYSHFTDVGDVMDAFIAGPMKLDRIEVHGPSIEIKKMKVLFPPTATGFEPLFFEEESTPPGGGVFSTSERIHKRKVDKAPPSVAPFFDKGSFSRLEEAKPSFFARLFSPSPKVLNNRGHLVNAPKTMCSMDPQYTVSDWPAAKPIIQDLIKATTKEPDCLYFEWTTDGDKLRCQEAYTNGDAVVKHYKHVGPILDRLLKNGAATLTPVHVEGPIEEVEKTEVVTNELNRVAEHRRLHNVASSLIF